MIAQVMQPSMTELKKEANMYLPTFGDRYNAEDFPLLDGSNSEDITGGATIEGAKATTERVGDGLILCIYINTM